MQIVLTKGQSIEQRLAKNAAALIDSSTAWASILRQQSFFFSFIKHKLFYAEKLILQILQLLSVEIDVFRKLSGNI